MENAGSKRQLVAFLAAQCLFLSVIEYAIPKPLPFLRLGLANMPIILALYRLKKRDILCLLLLKVFGQGFVSGTFFSHIFLFSAAGSCASVLAMMAAVSVFKTGITCVGISLAGALANNFVQLILAYFVLFGGGTRYIAPVLLINGAITGFLLGVCTERFKKMSKWFLSVPEYRNEPAA